MILTKKKEILSTKSMILSSLFVALIAIGAFIKVPVPVCPFTLQLLFTTLAGLLLGANLGFVSVCVYIIIGLIGIPIFTEGGGPGYIFQPTFGYLIGFAFGAYVAGYLTQNRTKLSFIYLLCVNFLNLLIVSESVCREQNSAIPKGRARYLPVTYVRFLWIFRLAGASTGIFIMENRQTDIPSRLFPSCPDVAQ